jgi:hypothetical protein
MNWLVKSPFAVLGLLVILANVSVKLYFLNEYELQGDEAFSVFHAQQRLTELINTLNGEANPPVYYILLHFWIKLFGIAPVSVKLLNIILSFGTAVMIVAIGKRLNNLGFALFASIAFLFSNLHFEFSQEIRAFQLVLLLTVCSYYFFISYFETKNNWYLLGVGLTILALPYTHYNAALVPIIQGVSSLFFIRTHWKQVWKLWMIYLFAGLLFLPQYLIFREVIPPEDFWLKLSNLDDFFYVVKAASGYEGLYKYLLPTYAVLPFLVILFKRFGLLSSQFQWKYFLYFWLLFILPLALNFSLAQFAPSFQLRYVIFTGLGIYFSLGYFIFSLNKNYSWISFISVFFIAMFIYEFKPSKVDNEGWKDLAELVRKMQKNERVGVVITASYKLKDFIYYYNREDFADYTHFPDNCFDDGIFALIDSVNTEKLVDLSRFDKLVYIRSNAQFEDESEAIIQYFDSRYHRCYDFGDSKHGHVIVYNIGVTQCFDWQELSSKVELNSNDRNWNVKDFEDRISSRHKFEYDYRQEEYGFFDFNSDQLYSPCLTVPVRDVQMVSVNLNYLSSIIPSTKLIISVELNGNSLKRIEFPLGSNFSERKGILSIQASLPLSFPENSELKVYCYNPNGDRLVLNDCQITIWK